MAFANSSYTDIIATTIESRSRKIADNVTANNAGLMYIKKSGNVKPFSGGTKIIQELSFAENANQGWYSGYDLLPTGASDVISAAEFNIKQCAVPVVISGLEQLQNSGKEQMIDLLEARISVAEATMANLLSDGFYSDGTGSGGKEVTGLGAACPVDPTATSYGGIDGNVWAFWKNYVQNSGNTSAIETDMNEVYASTIRGGDHINLILADYISWAAWIAVQQGRIQFVNTDTADTGFTTTKFFGADLVLDGGIYPTGSETGAAGVTASTMYFLNTKYLHWRPHRDRNMVPLSPNRRYAVNQDAEVQILAWAGNLTCSGRMFQGRIDFA